MMINSEIMLSMKGYDSFPAELIIDPQFPEGYEGRLEEYIVSPELLAEAKATVRDAIERGCYSTPTQVTVSTEASETNQLNI